MAVFDQGQELLELRLVAEIRCRFERRVERPFQVSEPDRLPLGERLLGAAERLGRLRLGTIVVELDASSYP
jgi:hypothetical protein